MVRLQRRVAACRPQRRHRGLFAGAWGTLATAVTHEVEKLGQHVAELGIDAYPEFVIMPEPDD